jgi:hypothetical protein
LGDGHIVDLQRDELDPKTGVRKTVFRRFMPTNALASEGKMPKNLDV